MCVMWISYPLTKILLCRSMSIVRLGTIQTHFQSVRLFFIIKVNLSLYMESWISIWDNMYTGFGCFNSCLVQLLLL